MNIGKFPKEFHRIVEGGRDVEGSGREEGGAPEEEEEVGGRRTTG